MSIMRPELIMKSVVPVVMAGIIAIYGVVIAVLISQKMEQYMPLFKLVLLLIMKSQSVLCVYFSHTYEINIIEL